jgi:hypothetical protein
MRAWIGWQIFIRGEGGEVTTDTLQWGWVWRVNKWRLCLYVLLELLGIAGSYFTLAWSGVAFSAVIAVITTGVGLYVVDRTAAALPHPPPPLWLVAWRTISGSAPKITR